MIKPKQKLIRPTAKFDLKIDADTSWLADFKRDHGNKHLLAFSRGKDSIACWLVLRAAGIEVIPYHKTTIPGMEFVIESLAYFEKFFRTKIYEVTHPAVIAQLDKCVLQPPEHVAVINRIDPKALSHLQLQADVRKLSGAPLTSLAGSGVRACDSIVRRMSFQQHGWIRPKQEAFYPCWNFNKAAVMSSITEAGVKLPADYELFGRSFDGLDYRFVGPLKKHRPRDYARVLELFPLVELEIFRHERLTRP